MGGSELPEVIDALCRQEQSSNSLGFADDAGCVITNDRYVAEWKHIFARVVEETCQINAAKTVQNDTVLTWLARQGHTTTFDFMMLNIKRTRAVSRKNFGGRMEQATLHCGS